jgi:hypothetical protein
VQSLAQLLPNTALGLSLPLMETITSRTCKDEIITHACEAIDNQQETINRLKAERSILVWIVVCTVATMLIR